MLRYRFIVVLALSAGLAMSPPSHAWTVTPRTIVPIDTTAVPGAAELSGLAYRSALGGSTYEFVAVQDSGNQLVSLSATLNANGDLTSAAATSTLTLVSGADFEGVALGPSGSIIAAEETTPAIRRYNATTGATITTLPMPAVFGSARANFGFESLTRGYNGDNYWTANEEALTPDGARSTTSHGTTVRLQRFDYSSSGTLTLGPQYAYDVDPIHVGTTTDGNTRSGLSDLVVLPDNSLLTLERSLGISGTIFGIPIYDYQTRIYRVTFAGATDTSVAPLSAGLNGQVYTPVSKSLLWPGAAGGNLEGLALGPMLANGDWSLIGVVDNGNGSDPFSANSAVSFTISPDLPGDFTFDGHVDSADYVAWRKGLGGFALPAHYDLWRRNYGRSLAGAAGLSPVPEPTALALLGLAALLCNFSTRRHA